MRAVYYRTNKRKRIDDKAKVIDFKDLKDLTQDINNFITNFTEVDKICSEEVYKILSATVIKLNDVCEQF